MDAMRARLLNCQQGNAWLNTAYQRLKPWLFEGHAFDVVIKPATRSLDQNAKFHSLCQDLARSGLPWAGKPRSLEQWKAILVSGHAVATGQGGEVIPGIEGEFVAIRESTAQMTKARSSSLIEYALAFCAQNEIACQEHE